MNIKEIFKKKKTVGLNIKFYGKDNNCIFNLTIFNDNFEWKDYVDKNMFEWETPIDEIVHLDIHKIIGKLIKET